MSKLILLILLLMFSDLYANEKVSLQLKWKHSFQFAGFYMAKEKGFYKNVGLDVTLKELDNKTDLVNSVLTGKANYGIGDSALIYYILRHKPIILMMPILENSPLALLTTKNVKFLSDFKSNTILINAFSLKSPAILSMLYVSNIDLNKLKTKIGVFSIQDMLKSKLDLYAVYIPNQPYYLKKNNIKYHIFSPIDYGLDFYGDMLFTSEKELDKHFDRAIRFMEASKKGWNYALNHIDETVNVIQKKYNSQHYSKDELLYQAHAYQKFISKNYKFNRRKLENIKIIFQLFYKLNVNLSYNDFVLNRYIATKEEREFLKNHHIRCITTTNWAPFNLIKDGKVVGLGIDYWHIIANKLHIDNSCKGVNDFSTLLNEIKNKKADLTISTSQTPDREKYALFSKSYATFPIAVATKRGATYTPDINSIKDKTFALVKSHTATKLLLEKVPNLKYIQTDTLEEALKLVDKGKVHATVEILPVLAYTINNKNFNNLEISGTTELNFSVRFMIRKDYKELLPMINRVIDSIDKQTKKDIYNKWISVSIKNGYSKTQVNKFIIVVIITLLIFFIWILILILEIKKRKRAEITLEKLANFDKLTSIYNRNKIDDFLTKQLEISKKYNQHLSIIFFDIDNFKKINDNYGHKSGDSVLKEIASIVTKNIRQSDGFGRWGGEEFLIILPNTKLRDAISLAEKLKNIIGNHTFKTVGKVTCSFGVVEANKKDSLDKIIKRADTMLYKAKKSGKNRVESSKTR